MHFQRTDKKLRGCASLAVPHLLQETLVKGWRRGDDNCHRSHALLPAKEMYHRCLRFPDLVFHYCHRMGEKESLLAGSVVEDNPHEL